MIVYPSNSEGGEWGKTNDVGEFGDRSSNQGGRVDQVVEGGGAPNLPLLIVRRPQERRGNRNHNNRETQRYLIESKKWDRVQLIPLWKMGSGGWRHESRKSQGQAQQRLIPLQNTKNLNRSRNEVTKQERERLMTTICTGDCSGLMPHLGIDRDHHIAFRLRSPPTNAAFCGVNYTEEIKSFCVIGSDLSKNPNPKKM